MKKIKLVLMAALISVPCANLAMAQDSKTPLYPEFSSDISFSSGLFNIDENQTVSEIPGLSSDYEANLGVTIKGDFTRASEYSVEKEDGIETRSGVGYEVALDVDINALQNAISGSSSYTETSDTNKYSLIQPMIDWYEASWRKYGLPSPSALPFVSGAPWPTTSYGQSTTRYQFIQGSTVEKATDVIWDSQKWADAQALYNDIRFVINSAIKQLDSNEFGTSDIDQNEYQTYTADQQKRAQLKQKAKREFSAVSSGSKSAKTLADSISKAYIKVTNIAGVVDTRIDFLGKTLDVGQDITSYIAGQTDSGSAVEVSLKQGLIKGLSANLAVGLAGGEEQNTENYDTVALEYYKGLSGELAVKAGVRYNYFIQPISANLYAGFDGVYSDALVANKNFALDAFAKFERADFISCKAGLEGLFLNYKDRELDDSYNYQMAYSVAANAGVRAYGASLNAKAQYKSAYFSHETYNTTEDRFYGYTVDSDYYIANLKSAAIAKAELEFNPQYFTSFDIVSANLGAEAFMYDYKINGLGVSCGFDLGFEDLFNIPVTVFGKAHYYKNSALSQWADYNDNPTVLDYTQLRAGVKFNPVEQLELSCEYVTSPSYSHANTERISSFTLNGRIDLD